MGENRVGTPVGPLLDALDVRVPLSIGQQLVEVLVVGKVVDFTAERRYATSMVIGSSVGLDWIGQRGLLATATDILAADLLRCDDESAGE